MILTIPYAPTNELAKILNLTGEHLECEEIGRDRVRLTGYGNALDFVPGDILHVEGATFRKVTVWAKKWLVVVYCNQPSMDTIVGFDDEEWALAELYADALEEQLSHMGPVYRPTKFSVYVATENREWLDSVVAGHPAVRDIETRRRPGEGFDVSARLVDMGMLGVWGV